MVKNKVKLLGFNINTFDFESAIICAKDLIRNKKGGHIITINPEMIEFGLKNVEFAEILNNAEIVIPDGVGIKIGLKIKGVNSERISGIDFSHKLIKECSKNGFSVGLIGAKAHTVQKTSKNLKKEFENLTISYVQDGYFQDKESVLNNLKSKSPQLLLVAMGCPKQEEFIKDARNILPKSLMIGVGGSFDIWSKELKRAPVFYQRIGLEWLYRTIKEPQRFKRIFPTLPRFILRVLFSKRV